MTQRLFKIEITGEIPDGDHDMDAEAKVATKAPVLSIVEQLTSLGMQNVSQHRRTIRHKTPVKPAEAPGAEPAPLESSTEPLPA